MTDFSRCARAEFIGQRDSERAFYFTSHAPNRAPESDAMNRTAQLVLVIILVLLLIGMLPAWPYSSGWGYYPSGGVGLLVLILVVLLVLGGGDRRKLP